MKGLWGQGPHTNREDRRTEHHAHRFIEFYDRNSTKRLLLKVHCLLLVYWIFFLTNTFPMMLRCKVSHLFLKLQEKSLWGLKQDSETSNNKQSQRSQQHTDIKPALTQNCRHFPELVRRRLHVRK